MYISSFGKNNYLSVASSDQHFIWNAHSQNRRGKWLMSSLNVSFSPAAQLYIFWLGVKCGLRPTKDSMPMIDPPHMVCGEWWWWLYLSDYMNCISFILSIVFVCCNLTKYLLPHIDPPVLVSGQWPVVSPPLKQACSKLSWNEYLKHVISSECDYPIQFHLKSFHNNLFLNNGFFL